MTETAPTRRTRLTDVPSAYADERDSGFGYVWNVALPAGEKVLITAIGYDSRGKITLRSAEGEKVAVIGDYSDPPPTGAQP